MKMCQIINYMYPVKIVIRLIMEIPCHFMSQIDRNLVQIDTKFHDYSMSFIQVLFVFHIPKHDMDFTEVQVMEFPWHERQNDPLDFHRI